MAEQAAQPQRNFQLNLVQVADLSCRILHQIFVKQPKDKAKAALKDLKAGKGLGVGTLTLSASNKETGEEQKLELPLKIKLDYREFRGPFNFPSFEASVRALVQIIAQTLEAKGDLNILTEQSSDAALLHLPGVIQDSEGRYNVMVMVVEPLKARDGKMSLVVKLLYVDPDQYEQLRSEPAGAEEQA
ncbi:MAG: hypothetical protein OIF35_03505 [Cellvibrionaceae bacterium]|nr:hypothetical protein [Cellvibrionaceae bacterium]MCV6625312.1 hypothetical protein [Cellvibrionaceae bacterium]